MASHTTTPHQAMSQANAPAVRRRQKRSAEIERGDRGIAHALVAKGACTDEHSLSEKQQKVSVCCRPGFLVHLSDTSRQQLSASRLSVSQLSVSSLPEHRRVTRSRPQNERKRRAQGAQRISQERHPRTLLQYAGPQEGLARCASAGRSCVVCPAPLSTR